LHLKKTKLISLINYLFQKGGKKGKQNHPLTFRNNPTSSKPPKKQPLEKVPSLKKKHHSHPLFQRGRKRKIPHLTQETTLGRGKSPPPFPTQKIALLKNLKKRKIPNLSFLLQTPLITCNIMHSTYFYYLPFISIQTPIPNNNPFAKEKKLNAQPSLSPLPKYPPITLSHFLHFTQPNFK